MAITFPRNFPVCASFVATEFVAVHQQARSLTGGGSPDVVSLGPTLWRGRWTARCTTRAQYGEWAAWLNSLRGGLRTFQGRPPWWRWPMSYPRGFGGLTVSGSAWGGAGNLQTIGATKDVLTINQVPIGLKLLVGDWLSIPVGSRQTLHQVTEAGTANGSGIVTVTVEPPVKQSATTGVEVTFEYPWCDMVLSDAPSMDQDGYRDASVSFEGLQVIV